MSKRALVNTMISEGLISQVDGEGMLNNGTTLEANLDFPDINPGVAVASVATADAGGTYTATEQALVNENKAQLNALIASLRTIGIIAT